MIVGEAAVRIRPITAGFEKDLRSQINGSGISQDAEAAGEDIGSHLRDGVESETAKLADDMGGGGRKAGGNFGRGLLGGIGPAILGINAKVATIGAGVMSLVAGLPGLGAGLAIFTSVGAGLETIKFGINELIKSSPVLKAQFTAVGHSLQAAVGQGAQAMLGPLQHVFAQLPGLIRSVEPALHSLFAGAGTMIEPFVQGLVSLARQVLPELGQMFRATAPLVHSFLSGFGQAFSGIIHGLSAIISAAKPAVGILAGVFGTMGADIGKLFADMAPAVKAGSQIFSALMDTVNALFPTIGTLASILASALAPAFTALAHVVRELLPAIEPLGKILGALAGAVITDFVYALQGLATMLKDMSPAFRVLTHVAGQLFNTLENAGVFAVLGDALHEVAPLLAKLINQLVAGLAPVLPLIVKLIAEAAQGGILVFADALRVLLPALTVIVQILGMGLTSVLQVVGPLLQQLAPIIGMVWAAVKMWTIAQMALNLVMDANPIGLIIIAIAALIAGIIEVVTHLKVIGHFFASVWHDVESLTRSAWNAIKSFLTGAIHTIVNAIQTPIRAVVSVLEGIWSTIRSDVSTAFNWIISFIESLPGRFLSGAQNIGRAILHGVISFVTHLPGDVLHLLEGLAGTLATIAGKAFSWAIGIGKQIVSGVLSGLGNIASDIWNAIFGGSGGGTIGYLQQHAGHGPSTGLYGVPTHGASASTARSHVTNNFTANISTVAQNPSHIVTELHYASKVGALPTSAPGHS